MIRFNLFVCEQIVTFTTTACTPWLFCKWTFLQVFCIDFLFLVPRRATTECRNFTQTNLDYQCGNASDWTGAAGFKKRRHRCHHTAGWTEINPILGQEKKKLFQNSVWDFSALNNVMLNLAAQGAFFFLNHLLKLLKQQALYHVSGYISTRTGKPSQNQRRH